LDTVDLNKILSFEWLKWTAASNEDVERCEKCIVCYGIGLKTQLEQTRRNNIQ